MTGLCSHQHHMGGRTLSNTSASMGWHEPYSNPRNMQSDFLLEVASSIPHCNNTVSECTNTFNHPAAAKQYKIILQTGTFGVTMLVEL